MKILFVSNDPSIFDEKSEARARMRAYAAAIGELHIVSPAPAGTKEAKDYGVLHLYPVVGPKIFRVGMLARKARQIIVKYGIDAVSAQDPFEQGLAAMRAIRGTNAKLHVQVHTDFLSPWFAQGSLRTQLLNNHRKDIADKVFAQAKRVRVVSERIKQSLVQKYPNLPYEPTVIPVAVDAHVPEPVPLPEHSFSFALVAVGRLEPEKRIEDIITALALLAPRYPMIGLVVIGSGGERGHLEKLARDRGLKQKVIFADGWLPAEKARGMMRSAQVFVQASAYEGYGRTLIEAALAGMPIITTDAGIVHEVFHDESEALVVPVGNPAGIAVRIQRLIEDNALRYTLGARAQAAAQAHLTTAGNVPERIAEDLRHLLL